MKKSQLTTGVKNSQTATGDYYDGKKRSRTCLECPYSYSYSDTDSYGCLFFGEECAGNKKFDDDDVCYVHPKRLQFFAQRMNKHNRALDKECCKYRPEHRKPVTSKKFINGQFHSGYEVIVNQDFLASLSKFYRPNMKGGHRHNHIKNMELRLMLTKKKIKEDK